MGYDKIDLAPDLCWRCEAAAKSGVVDFDCKRMDTCIGQRKTWELGFDDGALWALGLPPECQIERMRGALVSFERFGDALMVRYSGMAIFLPDSWEVRGDGFDATLPLTNVKVTSIGDAGYVVVERTERTGESHVATTWGDDPKLRGRYGH